MKAIVIIPMTPYSSLLGRCEITSTEYHVLKNGIIQHRKSCDEVQILCDCEQAQNLKDFVRRCSPELIPTIHQIDLPPDF